ncbi:MAG: rod shape-determining protein MreC [Rhodospirillales bacterium]|nr:rod shape-determining protein MreC [Rhodospirillales bacterium]
MEKPRLINRFVQPMRGLLHRFAYFGLIAAAFGLMIFGKVDALLMDRVRVHVVDAVAPILDALSRPAAAVDNAIVAGREFARIHEENATLRTEVEKLRQWESAARHLENENESLKTLLGWAPPPEAIFVTARVIADTGGTFVHSMIVGAGARDGVKKGLVVMTGEGLAGRIASVGNHSARLLLLTDLNSRIPAIVERTRTRAILVGDNTDRPRLVYLSDGGAVTASDRIVTSGHGGVFPPGLPIGVVISVAENGVLVKPFVERARLEFVRVVDFGLEGILEGSPPPRVEPAVRRRAARKEAAKPDEGTGR